jgi:hypothetical protein
MRARERAFDLVANADQKQARGVRKDTPGTGLVKELT